jgi:hypothetical protein
MRTESGSSLACWRTCPKKYEFTYDKRLSSRGYDHNLWYGSFVHAQRAVCHAERLPEEIKNQVAEERDQILELALSKFPQNEADIRDDWDLANRVVMLWRAHWSAKLNEYGEAALEFLDVEGEWSIPVQSEEHRHVGKRDGYLRHRTFNSHFLYELKTASSHDKEGYLSVLNLDYQINSNLLALEHEKKPYDGALYDIIWKPDLRRKVGRKTMADETRQEFNDRLIEEIRSNMDEYFQRVFITRTNEQLEQYQQELTEQFRQLDGQSIRYRNPSACRMYNRLCGFHQACMDPDSVELQDAFTIREKKHPELSKVD